VVHHRLLVQGVGGREKAVDRKGVRPTFTSEAEGPPVYRKCYAPGKRIAAPGRGGALGRGGKPDQPCWPNTTKRGPQNRGIALEAKGFVRTEETLG